MHRFSIENSKGVSDTRFHGEIALSDIHEVIQQWSNLALKLGRHAFIFDFSMASLKKVSESEALGIANINILGEADTENKLLVGILPNARDYALACIWATGVNATKIFPR